MIVRKFHQSDIQQIQKIYNEHHFGNFSVPRLEFVLSSVVVEHDGQIYGYGALERVLEGTLILDLSLPMRDKIKTLEHIIDSGVVASNLYHYNKYYVFPSDEKFSKLLQEKFNFEQSGPILCLDTTELRDGQ